MVFLLLSSGNQNAKHRAAAVASRNIRNGNPFAEVAAPPLPLQSSLISSLVYVLICVNTIIVTDAYSTANV